MLSDGTTMSSLSGPQLLFREQRLILPGEQRIADAAIDERDGGAASPGIQHRNVLVELAHEVASLHLVAARLPQRPGPGGKVIPARSARALRVRRDDLYARANQIVPIADVLRIALADQKDDGGCVGRAVVGQARGPVRWYQMCLARKLIDVIAQRQCRDIGLQPIDDGARLLARTAMALADRDLLARLRKPLADEARLIES